METTRFFLFSITIKFKFHFPQMFFYTLHDSLLISWSTALPLCWERVACVVCTQIRHGDTSNVFLTELKSVSSKNYRRLGFNKKVRPSCSTALARTSRSGTKSYIIEVRTNRQHRNLLNASVKRSGLAIKADFQFSTDSENLSWFLLIRIVEFICDFYYSNQTKQKMWCDHF